MQLPRKHRDEALLGEIIEQLLAVREFLYSPLLGKVPPPAIFSLVSQGNMCDHSANPTLKAEASWPVATSLPQRSMSIPNVISPLVKKQHTELRVDTRPCTWKRVLNCFNHVKCCQSSALLDNNDISCFTAPSPPFPWPSGAGLVPSLEPKVSALLAKWAGLGEGDPPGQGLLGKEKVKFDISKVFSADIFTPASHTFTFPAALYFLDTGQEPQHTPQGYLLSGVISEVKTISPVSSGANAVGKPFLWFTLVFFL